MHAGLPYVCPSNYPTLATPLNLFRTPPCYTDLVIFHAVECLSCEMTSPFCQLVKNFSSPPVTTKIFLHENFSYEIFSTRIFSNLR